MKSAPWMWWPLLLAVLVAANCVYDPYCSVRRRASCADVDPARLRDVVSNDHEIKIVRSGPTDDGTHSWCERGGITANVEISPDVVSVAVGSTRPPKAEEFPLWRERTDYICGRLRAACPEMGAWESREFVERAPVWMLGLAALVLASLAATGVWVLHRLTRGKPAAPSAGVAENGPAARG